MAAKVKYPGFMCGQDKHTHPECPMKYARGFAMLPYNVDVISSASRVSCELFNHVISFPGASDIIMKYMWVQFD